MDRALYHGKRVENGEWISGYVYRLSEELNSFIMIPDSCGESHEVITETVRRSLWLKEFNVDSDGNETTGDILFNGDIIEKKSEEDGDGTYLLQLKEEEGFIEFLRLSGTGFSDCTESMKRIGNWWDNPELIPVNVKQSVSLD